MLLDILVYISIMMAMTDGWTNGLAARCCSQPRSRTELLRVFRRGECQNSPYFFFAPFVTPLFQEFTYLVSERTSLVHRCYLSTRGQTPAVTP